MDVAIVKYNAGNIYYVVNAMKRLGIEPVPVSYTHLRAHETDNEILGDKEKRVIEDGTLFTIGATSIILRTADGEDKEK